MAGGGGLLKTVKRQSGYDPKAGQRGRPPRPSPSLTIARPHPSTALISGDTLSRVETANALDEGRLIDRVRWLDPVSCEGAERVQPAVSSSASATARMR